MDFKSKGISWVGNIYQKFETMCHEVDNFVSQDTVKYVENQVQTVGENMKKFCSDIVQDIIPPIVDPEAQAVALKRNAAIGAYIKSVISTEEDHGQNALVTPSPLEHSDCDPVKIQLANLFSGLHFGNQVSAPTSEEPLEGTEPDSASRKVDDVSANDNSEVSAEENSDVSTEENAMKEMPCAPEVLELIASVEKDSFEASFSRELSDSNHENASVFLDEVLLATSGHDEQSQSPTRLGKIYANCADDSDWVSDASSTVVLSEMAFSIASCEKKISEMELASSSSLTFTVPYSLSENSLDNIPTKVISSSNPATVPGRDSDNSNVLLSSTSAPTVSSKVAEMGLTSTNSLISPESIGYSDDCSYIRYDMTDSEMETIDLSDTVKLEESCVIVDDSMLYEVARRTRKLRSCKKKIQDVFASKRRLTKEYEQLAIWFGDLDIGSNQDAVQRQLSSGTIVALESDMPIHQTNDTEWELV